MPLSSANSGICKYSPPPPQQFPPFNLVQGKGCITLNFPHSRHLIIVSNVDPGNVDFIKCRPKYRPMACRIFEMPNRRKLRECPTKRRTMDCSMLILQNSLRNNVNSMSYKFVDAAFSNSLLLLRDPDPSQYELFCKICIRV